MVTASASEEYADVYGGERLRSGLVPSRPKVIVMGYQAHMANVMVLNEVLRDGRRGLFILRPPAGKAEHTRVFGFIVLRFSIERKKLI